MRNKLFTGISLIILDGLCLHVNGALPLLYLAGIKTMIARFAALSNTQPAAGVAGHLEPGRRRRNGLAARIQQEKK